MVLLEQGGGGLCLVSNPFTHPPPSISPCKWDKASLPHTDIKHQKIYCLFSCIFAKLPVPQIRQIARSMMFPRFSTNWMRLSTTVVVWKVCPVRACTGIHIYSNNLMGNVMSGLVVWFRDVKWRIDVGISRPAAILISHDKKYYWFPSIVAVPRMMWHFFPLSTHWARLKIRTPIRCSFIASETKKPPV